MSLIYNLSFAFFAMVCQIVYPSDGVPLKEMMGLEDFLQKLKLHLMEKVIYTKANNDLVINSEELPQSSVARWCTAQRMRRKVFS